MQTQHNHLQNVIETFVSPAATAVGGSVAGGAIAMWAAHARDALHANVQTAIDVGAYLAPIWLIAQIGCKVYVTFFKEPKPGDDP
jgi:hypothetical protein